jgi:hypothetical protein
MLLGFSCGDLLTGEQGNWESDLEKNTMAARETMMATHMGSSGALGRYSWTRRGTTSSMASLVETSAPSSGYAVLLELGRRR